MAMLFDIFHKIAKNTGEFLTQKRTQTISLRPRLSIKSVFTPKQQSRGSAHSKAFAAQTHGNRGRVPRFSYFKREKVSVWELSDVRVLRSQNTDCRRNCSFATVSFLLFTVLPAARPEYSFRSRRCRSRSAHPHAARSAFRRPRRLRCRGRPRPCPSRRPRT